MQTDILVVDDEPDIRELIAGILEDEGHETRIASNATDAIAAVEARRPGLVFLDIWLQGSEMDGLAVLDTIQKRHPGLPVVMISGHGNIETAVSAIQRGAYDYIEKPFNTDRLMLVAQRALEARSLKQEVDELKSRQLDLSELVGISPAMNSLRNTIARIAPTNSRVLIEGGSGSGKEMVARAIHRASHRANGRFVVLNAAAMTPERMEVELFGHEGLRGTAPSTGALEEAHGGTLYLDEISGMPKETQAKILRVLVAQEFTRVGGANKVRVDVRVISSTAQNIAEKIAEGVFRDDLFNRLAVTQIAVPPLSDRREDIPLIVDAFMKQISRQTGIRARYVADDAIGILQTRDWEGNVRQLRNVIERVIISNRDQDGETITADMLPDDASANLSQSGGENGAMLLTLPLREARERFERDYLAAQINRFGGNISKTAEFVGMERSALHRKLKSLGV
ncbi:MAG: sigma-54 dependent transcriptional regulator [Pseudomonadota bacterium]